MTISVVTSMYFSERYLREFHSRTLETIRQLGFDYEMILVDDGSPDNSLTTALDLQKDDPKIKIIELSRNFGHHIAIMAGLDESRGDLVFLIDCDLEEPPELLTEFHQTLKKKKNCDVVYGVQHNRKGDWGERFFGSLFYKVFNYMAYQKIPNNLVMARLMKRQYVDAIVGYRDKEFFLASNFANAGFIQEPVLVKKNAKGSTTYNLSKKIQMMVNAIVSSTSKPLVYIFYLGLFISGSVTIGASIVLYYHFFIESMQIGWPSLILSIWFLGGLILLSVGTVGIYLSKVYSESKKRPLYTIRQKHIVE